MMENYQFITRNTSELADIIVVFRELNTVCDKQLILSLDKDSWEVFDLRRCEPLCRYGFKQIRPFREWMVRLKQDIINVSMASYRKSPTGSQVSSIKRLYKLYGLADYLFNENIKSYIYGKEKENY